MIPHHFLDYTETFAYPLGFRNVGFLLARVIEFDRSARILYVHRGNPDRPIPIHVPAKVALGRWVTKDKDVDMIFRIVSTHGEDGKLSPNVRLELKHFSEPRLISLTFDPDFNEEALRPDRMEELFGSVSTDQFSKTSIVAQVTGWPDSYDRIDVGNGNQGLVVYIRQSESDRYLIPVILLGKHLKTYRKLLKTPNAALHYISTQSMIVPTMNEDGEPTVQLRTKHINLAIKDKDYRLQSVPQWVADAVERRRQALLERRAAQEARAKLEAEAQQIAESL